VTLAAFIMFFQFVYYVSAISIGVSPAEKEVSIQARKSTVIFITISQSSDKNEIVTITTDVPWIEVEPTTVNLEPFGQEFIKLKIQPLQPGTYNATVRVSASLPGVIGLTSIVSSKLSLSVYETLTPQIKEIIKNNAQELIEKAKEAIKNARKIGADTTEAEKILAQALEQFEKENYEESSNLAQAAFTIATILYNQTVDEKSSVLITFMNLFLITISVSAILIVGIIYWRLKKKGRKNIISNKVIVKGL